MVALAAVNEAQPGTIPLAQSQSLGRFLLFLQREDGSFVSRYVAAKRPVTNWQSLYYPGEAALGLIALYKTDHNREWLVAAAKALAHLAKSRAGLVTVPDDHWALIATAELLPYNDQIGSTVSRDELIRHAVQICNSILREQVQDRTGAGLDGAFDRDGWTTPAATRLEGLLATLQFSPKSELRNEVEAAVGHGVAFLLRAQITSGPYAGGIPGAVVTGAKGAAAIRIDYVQHALCAWLCYRQSIQVSPETALSRSRGAEAVATKPVR